MTKTVTLGETATFVNGYPFKPTDWKKAGLPIIRIQDLTGNAYETNYFNGTVPAKYYVHNGDVLISWSASLGVYEWQRGDAVLNQHIFKVVFDKLNIDKQYFKHIVSHKLDEMAALTHGATMKHITKVDFDNLQIPLPSLSEQRRIAALLDRADALRQKDRQLLAHYDQLAQSLFLDLFENNEADSPDWKEVTIEEVSNGKGSMRTGPFGSDLLHSEFVDEGVFVLGIDNVVNNRFEWVKPRYITEEKYKKLKRYTVYPGDILISIMGTTGRAAVVPDNIPDAINSKHLAAITLNKEVANPTFICLSLLLNSSVRHQIASQNKGAIMDGLNLGIIKALKLKLPPLSLQTHFAGLIEQIEKQKAVVRRQMAASEALFGRLLQESFG